MTRLEQKALEQIVHGLAKHIIIGIRTDPDFRELVRQAVVEIDALARTAAVQKP